MPFEPHLLARTLFGRVTQWDPLIIASLMLMRLVMPALTSFRRQSQTMQQQRRKVNTIKQLKTLWLHHTACLFNKWCHASRKSCIPEETSGTTGNIHVVGEIFFLSHELGACLYTICNHLSSGLASSWLCHIWGLGLQDSAAIGVGS